MKRKARRFVLGMFSRRMLQRHRITTLVSTEEQQWRIASLPLSPMKLGSCHNGHILSFRIAFTIPRYSTDHTSFTASMTHGARVRVFQFRALVVLHVRRGCCQVLDSPKFLLRALVHRSKRNRENALRSRHHTGRLSG